MRSSTGFLKTREQHNWMHVGGRFHKSMYPCGSLRPLIMDPPTCTTGKKQHTGPDYCASHPTTSLHGFSPDCWALQMTTELCTRLLGFHPTTKLLTRQVGTAPDYWAGFLECPQKCEATTQQNHVLTPRTCAEC